MSSVVAHAISLDFPLYHGSARSLKKTVFSAASGRLGQDQQHRVVVKALRDINFTLHSGDRLGLIGSNGAGKTSLLRVLAGIYEPTGGRVIIDGSIHALLDPNLGMNPDLTGRENIMLRGLYLGLNKPQILLKKHYKCQQCHYVLCSRDCMKLFLRLETQKHHLVFCRV